MKKSNNNWPLKLKRLTMMTAYKPVKIERRCQEQRHHCLHSLPSVLQTRTQIPRSRNRLGRYD